MRLQVPSLGGQRAIDQRAALQEAVEHRDQGPLVVVPSQAKLLADGHVAAFARGPVGVSRAETANIANSAVVGLACRTARPNACAPTCFTSA